MAEKKYRNQWYHCVKTGYTGAIIFLGIFFALFFSNFPVEAKSIQNVFILTIDGPITPVTYYKIKHAFSTIKKQHGQCLVLMMDTPGGLLISTRKIVQEILNSEIPVVCFVAPRGAQCASAGTFIALACHIVAMAPATNIGAAHPVAMGQEMDKIMQEKVINDTVSFIKSICRQTGRNEKWAERAVRESISITAEEAVKNNVADFIANDIEDLLNKIDGREVKLASGRAVVLDTKKIPAEKITESFGEKLLNVIGDPTVAYLLMTIGILGIIIEFSHPGFAVPGVVGTICLILSLFAFQTFTQSIAGVLLIITGIILLLMEVVAPGVGIFAIGGFIAMGLGTWLFFRSPQTEFHLATTTILLIYILLIVLVTAILMLVKRTRSKKVTTGKEGIVGEIGRTITELKPEGTVFVHGEYWKAISSGNHIPAGTKVRVKKIEGMMLTVEEIGETKDEK
ncbi:MAG: nodulation protein NfeD [Candidatus Omnitrophica bacterium]|nr:nodulation protein NfeD [Candidatus Omnitrophota bacterium]